MTIVPQLQWLTPLVPQAWDLVFVQRWTTQWTADMASFVGSDLMYIPNAPMWMMWIGAVDFNISQSARTRPNSIYQTRWIFLPTIGLDTNCVVISGLIDAVDAVNLWLWTDYGIYYVDDMFNLTQTETDVYVWEYFSDWTFLVNIQVEHGRIWWATVNTSPAIPVGLFEMRGDMSSNHTVYNTINRMSWTQHIVAGTTYVETWTRTGIFMTYDSNTWQPYSPYNKFFVNNGMYDFTVEKWIYNSTKHYFCGMTNETGVNQPYVWYHASLNNATPTFQYNIYEWIMDYVSSITVDTDTSRVIVVWWLWNDWVVLLVDSNLNYIRHRIFTANPGGYVWLTDAACDIAASIVCIVWQEDDYPIAIECAINLTGVVTKATWDQQYWYYNTVEFMYHSSMGGHTFTAWWQSGNGTPLITRYASAWLTANLSYELTSWLGYTWEITDIKVWYAPQMYFSWTLRNMFWRASWMLWQFWWWIPSHNWFEAADGNVNLNACAFDGKQQFVGKAPKEYIWWWFPVPWYDDGLFMRASLPPSIPWNITISLPWTNTFMFYDTDPVNEVWSAIIHTQTYSTPVDVLWTAPTVTAGTLTLTAVVATQEDVLETIEYPGVLAPLKDGWPHREFVGAPTVDNDSVDTAGSGWKFNPWYIWLDINTFPVTPYICLDSTPTAAVRSKMMMWWEDGYILESTDGTRHSITLTDDGMWNYNLDIWPTI